MSDQDIISLYQINTISNRQVMRIKKNISVWIISWFNTKFSEQTSKELYGRQSRELLMRYERVDTIVSLSPLSSGLNSSLFYTRYASKTNLANWNGYKRNASSTCAVPSISSISGVTSTNIRSFGVRAGSIHVTRVSPLHSSISEKPWTHFALYHFYDS